jgi:hypothetical protein
MFYVLHFPGAVISGLFRYRINSEVMICSCTFVRTPCTGDRPIERPLPKEGDQPDKNVDKIHSSIKIRTRDPSVRAVQDQMHLSRQGQYGHAVFTLVTWRGNEKVPSLFSEVIKDLQNKKSSNHWLTRLGRIVSRCRDFFEKFYNYTHSQKTPGL